MQLSEYVDHDATGLASLVNSGEVTALELARLAREAHDEVNPQINAVLNSMMMLRQLQKPACVADDFTACPS
ncbi:hypothetical protein ACMFL9_03205 (plasmid) [Sinorhizobium meliloti]